MDVYVDVLIFLNAVVDYLIISITAHINNVYIKPFKHVFASIFASLFSLAIFLPYLSVVGEMLFLICSAALITLCAFGFKSRKSFIKKFISFILVSVIYNGMMTVVWLVFKPGGMVLNNSIVYFNISPLQMIVFSGITYIIIRMAQHIFKRSTPCSKICHLLLENNGKAVELKAIVDTGNNLKDIYTGKHVVIIEKSIADILYDSTENRKCFLLPYKTVKDSGLMEAYPCSNAVIDGKLRQPVLVAIAKESIDSECKAILNPEILDS